MKKLMMLSMLLILGNLAMSLNAQTNDGAAMETGGSKLVVDEVLDLSGLWQIQFSSPRGTRLKELFVSISPSGLIGLSDKREFPIYFDGNKIGWTQEMSTPMGKIQVDYVGVVTDDQTMSGTFTMQSGPMAGRQMSWSAERQEK